MQSVATKFASCSRRGLSSAVEPPHRLGPVAPFCLGFAAGAGAATTLCHVEQERRRARKQAIARLGFGAEKN